ncbi:MAG: YncE family protein [candidate division WOR-3 bacterium]
MVKKYFWFLKFSLLLALSLLVCRKWTNPYDPAANRPPSPPRLLFPDSAARDIDTNVVLRWTCTDPDSVDTLKYLLYLGISPPPPLFDSGISDTFYHPLNLNVLATYYWRVVARDRFGETASSPVWRFATAKANNFPFIPSNPTPDSGAVGQFVRLTLSWSGGDPDPGDTVFYDIYLGTTTPPPLLIQNHNQTSYTPHRLKYDSTYYWRIVARDQRGATVSGPIWQFRTFPPIVVIQPNDTTRWRVTSQQTIRWTGGPTVTDSKRSGKTAHRLNTLNTSGADSTIIYYSTNGGTTWLRHGRATQSGSYTWTVPSPPSTNARVQVRMFISGDTSLGNSPRYEVYDRNKPSPITVTSPDSTAEWRIGNSYDIIWTGGTLLGMDSTVLSYSTNNGTTWQRIGATTRPSSYRWTVPGPATQQAKIRIRAFCLDSSTTGYSATFKIVEGLPPITITQPNSATRWREGSAQSILWTGGPSTPDSVVVFYSTNDGGTWVRHGRATTPGSYSWNVPGPATDLARVTVRAHVAGESTVAISARYVIYDSLPPSPITVTSPAAGARWIVGTTHEITWTGGTFAGMESTVIYYSTDGGTSWNRQGVTTQAGSYTWTVPSPPTANAQIAVRAWCGNHMTEGRSGIFTVTGAGGTPDTVLATITVGAKPRALLWDSLHNKIFVANYNDSSVTIIDGSTNQIQTTIRVGGFPYALGLNTLNGRVYVANQISGTVTVIDGASNQVQTTVSVGSYPQAMCFNSHDNRLYVSNYRSATVTVIDGNTSEVITTVPVDSNPIALVYNPAHNKIYCANFARNNVTVIDGTTNSVLGTVPVDYQPCALVVDSRNNVAVANRYFGKVTIINGENQSVITTLDVGSEPYALAFNATDNRLYCANSGTNNVSVINVSNYSLMTNISVGVHPRTLGWAGWVDKLFAVNYDGTSVSLIDGATNAVQKTIAVGSNPIAICINSWDSKVYIANYNSNTVTIIGPRSASH